MHKKPVRTYFGAIVHKSAYFATKGRIFSCFKYAPIASCDVERSFSRYRAMRRISFCPLRLSECPLTCGLVAVATSLEKKQQLNVSHAQSPHLACNARIVINTLLPSNEFTALSATVLSLTNRTFRWRKRRKFKNVRWPSAGPQRTKRNAPMLNKKTIDRASQLSMSRCTSSYIATWVND